MAFSSGPPGARKNGDYKAPHAGRKGHALRAPIPRISGDYIGQQPVLDTADLVLEEQLLFLQALQLQLIGGAGPGQSPYSIVKITMFLLQADQNVLNIAIFHAKRPLTLMIGDSRRLYHIDAEFTTWRKELRHIMHQDDAELWAFVTGVYAASGTEKVSLKLQDEFGADVVMVLFLVWLGLGGKQVNLQEMEALRDMAVPWQQAVIGPQRRVRRQLKKLKGRRAEEKYAAAKSSELAAERRELASLLSAALAWGFAFDLGAGSKAAAKANLRSYFETVEAPGLWPRVRESADLIVDRAAAWAGRRAGLQGPSRTA